jgi:hypothetical protein
MLAILKKWKVLIICGIVLVVLAYTADPAVEFLLRTFHRQNQSSIQRDPHWQYYTNRKDGYVVQFPSRPFQRPATLSNNPAIISYRQFVSVLRTNDCFMVATLVTAWTNDFTDKQIDFMLDKAVNGAFGKGDTLISNRNITLGTNPGKEIQFQRAGKFFVEMRCYRVGNFLQELTVLVPLASQQSTNISCFFDSFRAITE